MRAFIGILMLMGVSLFGQQLVIPKTLTPEQAELYQKVAISVVAPCCKNMIPVAYHESPMAQGVLGEIERGILAGKNEAEIHQILRDMRFNGNDEARVIFAIPEKNWLGMIAWGAPVLFIILFSVGLFIMLRAPKAKQDDNADDLDALRQRVIKDLS